MLIKVEGKQNVEIEVTEQEIGYALMKIVWNRCGNPDDAGCDWTTDDKGITCIGGNPDWTVSTDRLTAILTDAGNILTNGRPLKVTNEQPTEIAILTDDLHAEIEKSFFLERENKRLKAEIKKIREEATHARFECEYCMNIYDIAEKVLKGETK